MEKSELILLLKEAQLLLSQPVKRHNDPEFKLRKRTCVRRLETMRSRVNSERFKIQTSPMPQHVGPKI